MATHQDEAHLSNRNQKMNKGQKDLHQVVFNLNMGISPSWGQQAERVKGAMGTLGLKIISASLKVV